MTNEALRGYLDARNPQCNGCGRRDFIYGLFAAVAVGAMLPMSAKAADVYWTGSGDSPLLSDSGNWGATINASDKVIISETTDEKTPVVPDGTTKYYMFYLGTQAHTAKLIHEQGTLEVTAQHPVILGSGIGGIGTYNISGGTLSCPNTSDSALFVGQLGGVGYLNISGDGIVNCQKICLGTSMTGSTRPKGYVTISGNGKLNVRNQAWLGNTDNEYSEIVQGGGTFAGGNDVYLASRGTVKYIKTGGTFTVAQDLQLGKNAQNGSNPRGVGTLEHGGGTITVTRYSHIGASGTGTYVQSGGSIQCNNWTAIGRYSGGTGYCTVTGGTFTVKNTAGLNIGEEGTGTLTVGGTGVVTAGYGTTLGANNGRGTLKLGGDGKIVTKSIKKGSGTATLVEFDGGTIQAMADEAAFLGNLGNIQLGAGGLTIDTQGYNLGIINCTFNVSSNSGKLNVVGGGTVTFTDVTVNVTDNLSQAITFAERTDGGTFEFEGGLPEFNYRDWKLRVSGDKKTVRLVPPGLVIIVM